MAITENGYEQKRFETISPELKQDLRENLDPDLDTSSSSVAGVITDIYAAEIADLYSFGQAIYDSFNIDKAEGKALDDLVALIGVTRISATATSGPYALVGNLGTTVPAGSTFKAPNSVVTYTLDSPVSITNLVCTTAIITPNVAAVGGYTVGIGSKSITYTAPASPTIQQIVQGVTDEINLQSDSTFSAENINDESVKISQTNVLEQTQIIPNARFDIGEITSLGGITATTTGATVAPINTVTRIVSPVNGLTSAYNPIDLITGRSDETDEELRVRAKLSTRIAGTATVPAIEASLRQTAGVSQAFVIENTGILPDTDGRPAKSYECIVVGGAEEDIGETVWNTKPAGIETFGTTLVQVVDNNGNDQYVYFSRPTNKYTHARMTYEIYDEEVFPTDGETVIAQAILETGQALNVGEDVIVQRFYGPIYDSVSGIQLISLEMAVTDNPTDTPSVWVTTQIPIGATQVAAFDLTRISVAEA